MENILFASEMVGAVKSMDPETGFYFDDTKRYIEAAPWLSAEEKRKIYEGNARSVYGRLNARLNAAGRARTAPL
jgi:4-oxalmesaconate hydratase